MVKMNIALSIEANNCLDEDENGRFTKIMATYDPWSAPTMSAKLANSVTARKPLSLSSGNLL